MKQKRETDFLLKILQCNIFSKNPQIRWMASGYKNLSRNTNPQKSLDLVLLSHLFLTPPTFVLIAAKQGEQCLR